MKKEALAGGQPRSNASNPGFTLVELVIGGVLSSLVIGSIAVVAVNQIKVAERVVILNSINRNTRRVADLLKIEADEAFRKHTHIGNPARHSLQTRWRTDPLYLWKKFV